MHRPSIKSSSVIIINSFEVSAAKLTSSPHILQGLARELRGRAWGTNLPFPAFPRGGALRRHRLTQHQRHMPPALRAATTGTPAETASSKAFISIFDNPL